MDPETDSQVDPQVDAQVDPATEQDLVGAPTPVHELVADAVDATATAYAQDGGTDVVRHLRDVLAARGVATDDRAWLEDAAHRIRSGHDLDLEGPGGPGLPSL
jgi:hypothetical protein